MPAAMCINPRRWRVGRGHGFRPCGQSYITRPLVRVSSYNDNLARVDTRYTCHSDWRQRVCHYIIHCIRSYSDTSRNNFLHAQPMAWAILFESRTTILATVQHNWQCISWLYIVFWASTTTRLHIYMSTP